MQTFSQLDVRTLFVVLGTFNILESELGDLATQERPNPSPTSTPLPTATRGTHWCCCVSAGEAGVEASYARAAALIGEGGIDLVRQMASELTLFSMQPDSLDDEHDNLMTGVIE